MATKSLNPTDLINQFMAAQQAAQQANQAQFQQLLTTIKDLGTQTQGTFNDALGRIANLGASSKSQNDRLGLRTLAAGQQDLIRSGLSNTTRAPNLRRGVAEDVAFQNQAVDEGVAGQQAGLLAQRAGNETQIGGLLANAIGNQQNIGPDLGLFASLIQAAAAAGDPNQKVTAFVPPSSSALSAPIQVGGGAGGSPSLSSFGSTGGTGGPNGTAQIVRNKNAAPTPVAGPGTVGDNAQKIAARKKTTAKNTNPFGFMSDRTLNLLRQGLA